MSLDKAMQQLSLKDKQLDLIAECILLNKNITETQKVVGDYGLTDDQVFLISKVIATTFFGEHLHEISPRMTEQKALVSLGRKSKWATQIEIRNERRRLEAIEEDLKFARLEKIA